MASNPIPTKLNQLLTAAEDAADGLSVHETAVGVKQNTEASLRTNLAATTAAEATYQAAQAEKKALSSAQTTADSNGKALIGNAANILGNYLGRSWSAAWLPTGFPDQSTGVPRTMPARQTLLSSLQGYFTAHPEHENAPLGVTAAQAGTLFNALSDARSAIHAKLTEIGQKKAARDTAVRALRKQMRGLLDELAQLLDENDPLWHGFGFVPPGGEDTPDVPEAPTLTAGAAGQVIVDWPDAPRATSYRVFKQEVGIDADFVRAETVSDSDALLNGLTSGVTLRVRIVAVNDEGDESQASEASEIVVP